MYTGPILVLRIPISTTYFSSPPLCAILSRSLKFLHYCIQQCGIEKQTQFELENTSEYRQGDPLLVEYAKQKHELARAYLFVAKELL